MSADGSGTRCWAVIPAAGNGSRMGGDTPKQYLPLAGKMVIEHVIDTFAGHPGISGIVIALADGDGHRDRLARDGDIPVVTVTGGAERHHSVMNALSRLKRMARPDDWVLVHDAARPCLRASDLDRIIAGLRHHPVGGLLGVPVADTLKRVSSDGGIMNTLSRKGIWRALTPQMFRIEELSWAIDLAIRDMVPITDEAGAIERTARVPLMIEGRPDNIKITAPADLALAEMILRLARDEA